MANITGGANTGVRAKRNNKIVINASELTISELKEELLWLKGFDTDWSKEISKIIKEELSLRDIQAEPKEHIAS